MVPLPLIAASQIQIHPSSSLIDVSRPLLSPTRALSSFTVHIRLQLFDLACLFSLPFFFLRNGNKRACQRTLLCFFFVCFLFFFSIFLFFWYCPIYIYWSLREGWIQENDIICLGLSIVVLKREKKLKPLVPNICLIYPFPMRSFSQGCSPAKQRGSSIPARSGPPYALCVLTQGHPCCYACSLKSRPLDGERH